MAWQEGAEWVEYMLRRVEQSFPLTLNGFSIWSIPYLLQNGFSVEQITSFARTARKMLVKGLDDSDVSCLDEEEEMATIFSNWDPHSRISNLKYVSSTGFNEISPVAPGPNAYTARPVG